MADPDVDQGGTNIDALLHALDVAIDVEVGGALCEGLAQSLLVDEAQRGELPPCHGYDEVGFLDDPVECGVVRTQDLMLEELDAIDCRVVETRAKVVEIRRLGFAEPNVDVLAQTRRSDRQGGAEREPW